MQQIQEAGFTFDFAASLNAPDQDLVDLLRAETELVYRLAQLTSIPGIGLTRVIVVVAEMNGFVLVAKDE